MNFYSIFDVEGPINFANEPDKTIIKDYLPFYELLPLSKDKKIKIIFADHHKRDNVK